MIWPLQGRAKIQTTDGRLSAEHRQAEFVRLVETHHADLVRLAYVICGDRELAADVAQSTWQAAWAQLERLRDLDAARSWLLSIAANQARRQVRRRSLRRVLEPRSLSVRTRSSSAAWNGACVRTPTGRCALWTAAPLLARWPRRPEAPEGRAAGPRVSWRSLWCSPRPSPWPRFSFCRRAARPPRCRRRCPPQALRPAPQPRRPRPSLAAPPADEIGAFTGGGLWARHGGDFYLSTDGGTTWIQRSIDPDPVDVFVLDATHAWTVSAGPGSTGSTGNPSQDVTHWAVARTTDGGVQWPAVDIPGNYPDTGAGVTFVDASHGYLLIAPLRFSDTPPVVFATEDGGASWQQVRTAQGFGLQYQVLLSADANGTLWAGAEATASGAGDWTLLSVSRDGGTSWQPVSLPGRDKLSPRRPPARSTDGHRLDGHRGRG